MHNINLISFQVQGVEVLHCILLIIFFSRLPFSPIFKMKPMFPIFLWLIKQCVTKFKMDF